VQGGYTWSARKEIGSWLFNSLLWIVTNAYAGITMYTTIDRIAAKMNAIIDANIG
jgi:uncharacterized protein YfiM (DUF2279 family)